VKLHKRDHGIYLLYFSSYIAVKQT